jgi:DNA polymerase IV
MATGLAKPNGLLYLEPRRAHKLLGRLPVGTIPGVGNKAEAKLARYGIKTVADLASGRPDFLKSIMGRYGEKLLEVASGRDSRPVRTTPRPSQKSYSKDRTLSEDTVDYAFVKAVARRLAEKLAQKLRSDKKGVATVSLKVRYSDFTETARSMTLPQPSDDNREILKCVDKLFPRTVTRRLPIRQVCVRLSNIHEPVTQTSLFDPSLASRKARDKALDSIRNKYGFEAVLVSGTRPSTNC